ncbi:MAG: serine/threonine-protein kinase [Polyangia bacterium]
MSSEGVRRLGDYLLLKRIGEGGMAEVYLAQYSGADHSVGPQSQVVVKRIKPELFSKPDYPVFREMFLNEAKLVRELSHANLARIYALNEAVDSEVGARVPFIVGEYVQGSQLWELMRIATLGFTGRPVPAAISAFIVREMARGLGHAHLHKDSRTGKPQPIIHRDISPENVMISSDGQVKVIDFGVAKALGGFGPQTRTGIIKGKLAYMAPEQVAQRVLPATDVFGAAIVLHELLTGRRLFGGANDFLVVTRVLKAEIPRPSQQVPDVPRELEDVLMRALSRDLSLRYTDANALADALTQVLESVPALRGTSAQTLKKWSKETLAEGARIASQWQEEGEEAERRARESGDAQEPLELSGADVEMLGDAKLDPGVRAVATMGLKILRPDMVPKEMMPDPSSRPAGGLPGLAPVRLPGDEENEVKSSDVIAEMSLSTAGKRRSGRVPPPPPRRSSANMPQLGEGPVSSPGLPGSESTADRLPPVSDDPNATQDSTRALVAQTSAAQTSIERAGEHKLPAKPAKGPAADGVVAGSDSAARRQLRSFGVAVLQFLFRMPLPAGVKDFFFDPTVQRWLLTITSLFVVLLVLLLILLLR